MKSIKAVLWALITLLLIVLLFQNRDTLLYGVTLELDLFGTVHYASTPIPLYGLILCSLFLGVLLTALYCGLGNYRLRQKLRDLRRQNDSLQEELKSLRNLPITDVEMVASKPAGMTRGESLEEANQVNSGKSI